MKITKEICKTLFNHDFLKLNSEDKEKLDQLAVETLSDNSWEDVYSYFDQYLRTECNTEDDVINYVFLFIRYVGLNFNIPSQYDPYDLIGFILSKVDLEKRWDDCDSFDDFANQALRIDLYRDPWYQFWRDPKVIEAAEKYGGVKYELSSRH